MRIYFTYNPCLAFIVLYLFYFTIIQYIYYNTLYKNKITIIQSHITHKYTLKHLYINTY